MIKDFRLSGKKPNHRVGDFRAGLPPMNDIQLGRFSLIQEHNDNVRAAKQTLSSHDSGHVRKIPNGIQTTIMCGVSKKVIVKTFIDGTSQVLEENNA